MTARTVLCVAGVLASCTAASRELGARTAPAQLRVETSRVSMGCVYSIAAYGDDRDGLAKTLDEALDEVDRIDRLMSHYRQDSPLSRLNRDAGAGAVATDPELFDFLVTAFRYSRDSQGAFDVTVGPLMTAWGFFRGDGRVPDERELAQVRKQVGYRHVHLDAVHRTVRFDRRGVALDLGGIAKGYAVDRAVRVLVRAGVGAALVSAGGSTLYGLGAPPDSEGWPVAVQDPRGANATAFAVSLKNRALSVAGRSEKSFMAGGVTYSHIMDPRTGRPVQGMLSVAVLSATGTSGDALDDALFVLGVEDGRRLLRAHPDADAYFLPEGTSGHWHQVPRAGS